MKITELTYPCKSFEKLFGAMSPFMEKINSPKNSRFEFNSVNRLFFLKSGTVTVISDGFSNLVAPPFLFGLIGCLGYHYDLYIRIGNNSELYTINTDEAMKIIKLEMLWEEVATIIAYNNMLLLAIYSQMRSPFKTTKYKIAASIEAVYHLQKKHNKKMFLAKEIMSLTLLSRSIVMKNIAIMKDEGIIEIKRGVLIKFDESKLKKYRQQ